MLRELSKLDDRLIERVEAGDIRFVRPSWLKQASTTRILRRQDLEALEASGECSPLLSTSEAVALIKQCDRSTGALTYGWQSPGSPDIAGTRLEVVRQALAENEHIQALFWDFSSLHQHPKGGKRSEEEEAAFKRALGVMADVYASAVGTTVLQLKEISPRPAELDGLVCLFGLKPGVDEATIRNAFGADNVASCALDEDPPTVRFVTHKKALAAIEAGAAGICEGLDTLYNERSYDGRRGEDGRRDDDGRGW